MADQSLKRCRFRANDSDLDGPASSWSAFSPASWLVHGCEPLRKDFSPIRSFDVGHAEERDHSNHGLLYFFFKKSFNDNHPLSLDVQEYYTGLKQTYHHLLCRAFSRGVGGWFGDLHYNILQQILGSHRWGNVSVGVLAMTEGYY